MEPKATSTADRLQQALRSISRQCGNVIFNTEKTPATNAEHIRNWEQLKKYVDDTLAAKEQ